MPDDPSDLDRILEAIAGPGGGNNGEGAPAKAGMDPMAMMMMMMRMERQDRQSSSDRMIGILGALAPIIAPLLMKPNPMEAILPALLSRNDATEAIKQTAEASRASNQAMIDQLRSTFVNIIEMKDKANADIMEKTIERMGDGGGESESGAASILRELRLAAPMLGSMLTRQPAQPSADANPHAQPVEKVAGPTQQQQRPQVSPILAIVRQLKAIHAGTVPVKRLPMVRSAIATTALNDDALSTLLCAGDTDGVVSYVMPHIVGDADLMAWVQTPGEGDKAGTFPVADWLTAYVEDYLAPAVDLAINGPAQDDAGDDQEPEVIGAAGGEG